MARTKSATSMTAKVDLRLTQEQEHKLAWLSQRYADGNVSELLRSLIDVQYENGLADLMEAPVAHPWLSVPTARVVLESP